jgi:hypothetical protein
MPLQAASVISGIGPGGEAFPVRQDQFDDCHAWVLFRPGSTSTATISPRSNLKQEMEPAVNCSSEVVNFCVLVNFV